MGYTIKYMRPLGEHDPKYGTKYWGKVKETDLDVSFNLMNPVNFSEGEIIEYAEKVIKETKAGKEYVQLKKVKPSMQVGLDDAPVRVTQGPTEGAKKPDDYEPGTNARWAIGMAYRGYTQVMGSPPTEEEDEAWNGIGYSAVRLVKMFNKVKAIASGADAGSLDDSVSPPSNPTPEASEEEPKATGYAKATETAKRLKAKTLTADEANSLLDELREEDADD